MKEVRGIPLGSDNTETTLYQPMRITEFPIHKVHRRSADRLFFILRHLTPPPATILEIGCCLGYFSYYLGLLGYTVVATDTSHENISFCEDVHSCPNVKYSHADGFEVLSKDQFDFVICLAVTHHIHARDADRAIGLYEMLNQQNLFFETGYNNEIDFSHTPLSREYILQSFCRFHHDHASGIEVDYQPCDKSDRDIFYFGKKDRRNVRKISCKARADNYRVSSIYKCHTDAASYYEITTFDSTTVRRWQEVCNRILGYNIPFIPYIYQSYFHGGVTVMLEDVERSGFFPVNQLDVSNGAIIRFATQANQSLAEIGLHYFDYTVDNIFYNPNTQEFKLIDIVESLELNRGKAVKTNVIDNLVYNLGKHR